MIYLAIGSLNLCLQLLLLTMQIDNTPLPVGAIILPKAVWIDIVINGLYQVVAWLILTVCCFLVTRSLARKRHWSPSKTLTVEISLYSLAILTVYLANYSLYPFSQYGQLLGQWLNPAWGAGLLAVCLTILVSACVLAKPKLSLFAIILGLGLNSWDHLQITKPYQSNSQPNIILIGIDSLRYNDLAHLPFLQKQLQQSVVFNQGITPLARTLPAWLSVLSGNDPINHGVRFNNQMRPALQLKSLLSQTAQAQGYKTIYATDNTRFAPMTKSLGFDTLIAPKAGVSNFILGAFANQPMVNLLANTWLGRKLFPYHYANQTIPAIYKPTTLVNGIAAAVKNQQQPIFLATHLCTLHWPYTLSNKKISANPDVELYRNYLAGLKDVDKQLQLLWNSLQRQHVLDNSLVLIFNDHGETLGLPVRNPLKPLQLGHGFNVTSAAETRIFLAWQQYKNGNAVLTPQQRSQPSVSLIDIKPTVTELLAWPKTKTDGISLQTYFNQQVKPTTPRILLTETGYTLNTVMNNTMQMRDIIKDYLTRFDIDPNTQQLELNPQSERALINKKQRAAWQAPWLLALLPTPQGQVPLLLNTQTQQWSKDLNSPFAKASPAVKLLAQLKLRYGNEIKLKNS